MRSPKRKARFAVVGFVATPSPVHALRALFGAEPISVFAWRTMNVDSRSQQVDQLTTAILRFDDQRLAQITVSPRDEECRADVRVLQAISKSASTGVTVVLTPVRRRKTKLVNPRSSI